MKYNILIIIIFCCLSALHLKAMKVFSPERPLSQEEKESIDSIMCLDHGYCD